jgi:hypothetical protein
MKTKKPHNPGKNLGKYLHKAKLPTGAKIGVAVKNKVTRKKDSFPSGRDGAKGEDVHRNEKIIKTHRAEGTHSKPIMTTHKRAKRGTNV